jgi:hypothetical protein
MATPESIRSAMRVDKTQHDKGLTMILELTAYDNGLITINGRPLGDLVERAEHDEAANYLTVAELMMKHLEIFRKEHVVPRQRSNTAGLRVNNG